MATCRSLHTQTGSPISFRTWAASISISPFVFARIKLDCFLNLLAQGLKAFGNHLQLRHYMFAGSFLDLLSLTLPLEEWANSRCDLTDINDRKLSTTVGAEPCCKFPLHVIHFGPLGGVWMRCYFNEQL